jgi:hypothetical protein
MRLLLTPWWVRTLVMAGVLVLTSSWRGEPVWSPGDTVSLWAIALPAAGCLVLGGLIAAVLTQSRNAYARLLDDLPTGKWPQAYTATFRGPVPADADVRAAAARVAQAQLERGRESGSHRWLPIIASAVVFFAEVFSLSTADGARDAAYHALIAALFGYVMFFWWYGPRRTRRRLELLLDADDQTQP